MLITHSFFIVFCLMLMIASTCFQLKSFVEKQSIYCYVFMFMIKDKGRAETSLGFDDFFLLKSYLEHKMCLDTKTKFQ